MEDQQLVHQVLQGSESAFRLLIDRYARLVQHMVARVVTDTMDREELCQDVFVKVHEKLGSFNFEAKLSTWIATIAYRVAINFSKKKKLNMDDLDRVEGYIMESEVVEAEDEAAYVHKMIDKLPVHYKTIVTLFYLDGFSYPEIIEITEMPEGTIKNYLFRAKQKLRVLLEREITKEMV